MADKDEDLFCPITKELFHDPVTAEDGRVYERDAIIRWINQCGTSPFTRQILHIDQLWPNERIKKLADDRRETLSVSYSNHDGGQVELPLSWSTHSISPANNPVIVRAPFRVFRCLNVHEMWETVTNICLPCWASSHRKGICGIIFCTIVCLAVLGAIIYSIAQGISMR